MFDVYTFAAIPSELIIINNNSACPISINDVATTVYEKLLKM